MVSIQNNEWTKQGRSGVCTHYMCIIFSPYIICSPRVVTLNCVKGEIRIYILNGNIGKTSDVCDIFRKCFGGLHKYMYFVTFIKGIRVFVVCVY